jgi:hypothetical protein
MKSIYIFILILSMIVPAAEVTAQGCVAIRSSGGMNCTLLQNPKDSSGWMMNINNRYFKSYKHFVGKEEQEERVENGTEVINHTYTMDIFLLKSINHRWSIGVDLPINVNSRSSLYEHGGNLGGKGARHSTNSYGIGDIRVSAYRWLWNPLTHSRWNVQAGLGIKLPTGDYQYQDYFIKNDSVKVLGPVDQSIQLGDGGTGFTAELNMFYNISRSFSIYGNMFYLLNPREQNGVSTARGGTPTAASKAYGSDVMSVPDQFMIRGGINYSFYNMTASLGFRHEQVNVYDLVGGSNGFRRPGYVQAIEPGFIYMLKKINFYAYVPVALVRNRTQSVPDKIRTDITGVYAQGDAAFADYAVNVGVSIRL